MMSKPKKLSSKICLRNNRKPRQRRKRIKLKARQRRRRDLMMKKKKKKMSNRLLILEMAVHAKDTLGIRPLRR